MSTETKKPERMSLIDQALLATMEDIKRRDQRLEKLLPEGVDRSRFNEEVRFALAQNDALVKCTRSSLVLAVMRAARTGLPPDGAGGMAYIIPYGTEATFVPGYKGLIFLAKMTGLVLDMQPVLVREKDLFEVEEGDQPRVVHKPHIPHSAKDAAGAVIAAYTRMLLPGGVRVVKGMLYLPDLERIAACSRSKNGPRQGPHAEAMKKKDSIREAFKSLGVPSGDAFRRLRLALAATDAAETGEVAPELAEGERERRSGNTILREKLVADAPPPEMSEEEKQEVIRQEMAAPEPGSAG